MKRKKNRTVQVSTVSPVKAPKEEDVLEVRVSKRGNDTKVPKDNQAEEAAVKKDDMDQEE